MTSPALGRFVSQELSTSLRVSLQNGHSICMRGHLNAAEDPRVDSKA